ncbi:TetR/AcrR family transcriptional regulator [Microbacterium lacticum]
MTAVVTSRDRRRQQVRQDLAEVTLGLISAEGLDAVSIERLCDEGALSRATLYAHFPDGRDGVLRAAYERAGGLLAERAAADAEGAATWEDRIASYARTMIEFSSSSHLGHFYSVSGPHFVGFRAERGVGAQWYYEAIREQLRAAQAGGEVDADGDPDALAVLLASSLRDAGVAASHDPAAIEAFVGAVRALVRGLRVR